MAARLLGVVLADIIEAIDRILAATSGKSFVDFEADWLLSLATQRALEIISEASRHIPDERLERFPDIPWKRIRGIGNMLRHEYHKIADEVIWAVVTDSLVPLRAAVVMLQMEEGEA